MRTKSHPQTETLPTYHAMYGLFVRVLLAAVTSGLPQSDERWTRPAFTRKQLDALCQCSPEMPADEIRRRVRATAFPGYQGAYIEAGGVRFNA